MEIGRPRPSGVRPVTTRSSTGLKELALEGHRCRRCVVAQSWDRIAGVEMGEQDGAVAMLEDGPAAARGVGRHDALGVASGRGHDLRVRREGDIPVSRISATPTSPFTL